METYYANLVEKTVNSYGVEDLLSHPRKPHQSKFLLTRPNRRASGTAVMFKDRNPNCLSHRSPRLESH